MQTTEQTEFEGHVARLFAGYGVPATEDRHASFWTAFKVLSLLEFSRMVDHALSEQGLLKEKPSVPAMWGVRAAMKARPQVFTAGFGAPRPPEPEQTFGLRLIDQMLFAYIMRRRVQEQFKGGMHLTVRRRECLAAARWIDDMKAEDMLPSLGDCKLAFDNAMVRAERAIAGEQVPA